MEKVPEAGRLTGLEAYLTSGEKVIPRRRLPQRLRLCSAAPPPPLASSAFHPPSRINEPSEFLTELRKCAFPALRDSALIAKLLDCVMRKFLLVPNKLSWGEECEAVLTLLYVCLHYPTTVTPQFAEEVASEFVGRWVADSGAGSLGDIAVLITERNKCSSFALLLLLIGNHVPEKVDKFHLEACISWSNDWSPGSRAPDWLIDALGHNENIYSLKSMLFTSYMLLKGQPWTLEVRDNYTGVLVQYLAACKLYRESNYYESLSLLHEINLEECGTSLQGWVLWSTGLCLFKLGKSSTALVKLQEAIDKSNSSVPAIFMCRRWFRKMAFPVLKWRRCHFSSGRQQQVALDGSFSEPIPILSRVPQGSVLDPLISRYTSYMVVGLKNRIVQYDDATIVGVVKSPLTRNEAALSLNYRKTCQSEGILERRPELWPEQEEPRLLRCTRRSGEIFRKWCKSRKISSSSTSVTQIADFLLYLKKEVGLSTQTIKGYRSMLASVFRHRGLDITNNLDLRDLNKVNKKGPF
ncbi:uncharacterized protein LOC135218993 [Macrobrachium nipponense]|uniref:uncharacterized protein LOC135218993 n=1 Tax=Macrobrachium nipponense TaxID=159736 RepID=UPI0030C82372